MKYSISEIIGLAGSGKSTTIEELRKEYSNYIYEYSDKKINIYLLKYIFTYLRVYIKSSTIFVKSLILFHIFLHSIEQEEISTETTYMFDQGPIFTVCMLMYEIPSMSNIFITELKKILPYYRRVIYLEAPLDIISNRIKDREQQHRVKNMGKKEQEVFLKRYSEIYESVMDECMKRNIEVIRINTHHYSIDEVKTKINEIIHE